MWITSSILQLQPGRGPCTNHSFASNAFQRFWRVIRRFWRRWWPPSVQCSAQFFIATSGWLCIRFGFGNRMHSRERIRWAGRAVGLLWFPHARSAFQAPAPSLRQSSEKEAGYCLWIGFWRCRKLYSIPLQSASVVWMSMLCFMFQSESLVTLIQDY